MKQATIITGKQGTGKTILAMEMASKKDTIWTSSLDYINLRELLTENTGFIVLDEITNFKSIAPDLQKLMKNRTITFRKPYERNITIMPLPHIILITQNLSEIPKELQAKSKIVQL